MTTDLPGGLHPDELPAAEPGLEHLLRTLTSAGTPGELAGEHAATAMFRASVRTPASANGRPHPGLLPGALDAPTLVTPVIPAAGPAGSPPGRPRRRWRPRAAGGFPRLRVAVITATAVVGGFAAAAYAAVLPAPVQHIAYQAFHVLGVPDARPSHASGAPGGSAGAPGGAKTGPPSGRPQPGHSGSAGSQAGPSSAGGPSSQPSGGGSAPSGPAVLSGQAESTAIPAGTSATINGMLTLGGTPAGGVYIRLLAHAAGRAGWLQVGRTQTNAQGDVSFTTPVLRRNTDFVLVGTSAARSSVVAVTVLPRVSATLTAGPKGLKDYVTVATAYASKGDVVLLQVLQNGTWVTIKQSVLNAAGRITFVVSATQRQGEELQGVLLATTLHGEAASPPVTVPAPG
jgi:hypothetical protein